MRMRLVVSAMGEQILPLQMMVCVARGQATLKLWSVARELQFNVFEITQLSIPSYFDSFP